MKTAAVVLALVAAGSAPALAAPEKANSGAPVLRVPGRALVKLKGIPDANAFRADKDDRAARALQDLGKRAGVDLHFVKASLFGWAVVEVRDAASPGVVPDEDTTLALVELLQQDPAVEAAADEGWMRPLATTNDPGLAQMWHIDQIGAKAAWDLTTGNANQRIGIADTGIVRTHEDLSSRIVGGYDFVSSASAGNDGNGRDSDFSDAGDSCNGEPSSFHGTHVAGTIGAAANNGRGVSGLNWSAGLVVARVLGRCGGSTVDIMEGAAWMAGAHINGVPDVGANKVSVMNLSLGGAYRCSAYEQQVVDFIDGQGVVFVAAAGNDGGAVGSPSNCDKAVSVAAVGPTNRKTGYSSFGPEIDIAAPGGDMSMGQSGGVLSAMGPGSGYAFLQGTSMASPHVAGAISLVQALRPSMSRADIVTLLRNTGVACTGCQGVPALRIGAALAALGAPSTPPPSTPPPSTPPPAAGDDVFEENDGPAQATRATCGVDESRLVAAAGDQDWFTFTPPAGRRLAIAIDGGSADLDLYVLDASGRRILARSESTTGQERITGTAGGGTLMVLVNPYTDPNSGVAHRGPYRLTLTCGAVTTQSTSDFEAGDPFEDVLGEIVEGAIGNDPEAPEEEPAPVADPVAGEPDDGAYDDIAVEGGCSAAGNGAAAAPVLLLGLFLRRRRR